jgi:D-xylonolactonase
MCCYVLADEPDDCGESPLWDVRSSSLYWIDIVGRRISRYDWPSRSIKTIGTDIDVSGVALNESGGLVMVASDGVWLWDDRARRTAVVRGTEDFPMALNDCIADPQGRLLSGTCYFDPHRDDFMPGKLLSIDERGAVSVLDEGFTLANGLGFSPDCRTLYFTDSARREIFAYDYDDQSGSVRNRRTFVKVPDTEGLPDGLTVDAQGYVWSAQWFGSCICRYDPDGRLERRIPVPAKQTSSITFGGPDLTDVFITSAGLSDALPLAPPGYDPYTGNVGGQLFHANFDIQGKAEFRCRIGSH